MTLLFGYPAAKVQAGHAVKTFPFMNYLPLMPYPSLTRSV